MTQHRPIDDLIGYHIVTMAWKWRLFFLISFFGPAAYFGYDGDYVLAAIMAVAGCSAFSGFRIGATAIIASVAAIAAAVTYAPSIGHQHEWRFTEWFGTTGLLNRFVSIGAVGLSITVATSIVAMLVTGKLFRSQPSLSRTNKWLGFMIGGVEGVVASLFLLGGVLILEPIEQQRSAQGANQTESGKRISGLVLKTAQWTRSSEVGPYIQQYNPFVRFPELNKIEQVQKTVQTLSDPQKIERLMRHPEVQRLQSRPEVRTAVEKVMSDPEIRSALHSGTPMNRSIAMTLLNHPAILELIDQPGFLAVATKAIQATNLFRP